ncbi:L-lysine exporter family protein LysE/ArgO [Sphaerotilus hippei]|uniref:L-lysine exporter family protein LysE/ArgO n=1 Tax=Sphaerotilus hippei TaxID=744406 RepID=A0A318H4X5_9BURK|nr:LysE/ArgO family amino acid transporter [Sphaerotilus hippei]PXW94192.1 L-lysine exporter family protein LysE/ArgO [Sphaerotilus hippei]
MQASTPFLMGLASCLGLIIAIGAQNAFVLRQGLRREHVATVIVVCALCDALLILLGTAGMGWIASAAPWAVTAMTAVGVAFLLVYGLQAARRAWQDGVASLAMADASARPASQRRVALQSAAFCFLNPHAWLDTTVLLGSLAQSQEGLQRWVFAAGAVTGSVLWFTGLGLLARQLTPWFRSPTAWRRLDALIALMMFGLALGLSLKAVR